MRIIGGVWRSRRLPVADVAGLRPTTDRVRETVFNWLTGRLAGRRVLDAFAGTGALGFEALSRGAASLVAIESNREVAQMLRRNAATLGADAMTVECAEAQQWLDRRATDTFDLVFLDPPFGKADLTELCTLLVENRWLADAGLIYIEQAQAASSIPAVLRPVHDKTAGQVRFGLYTVAEKGTP